MKLFIGTIKDDYDDVDTQWVSAVGENEEQARESILRQLNKGREGGNEEQLSMEDFKDIYTISFLNSIDEVDGYKITLTKI